MLAAANSNLLPKRPDVWRFVQMSDMKKLYAVTVCQLSSNLLVAGYYMYSSSVIFVLTLG
ncbi:hypothetical protein Taro_024494 [Colocasia esculenta]|uniref:Uncharacterized protein n=1 Tax=Colocasia esculenta TaxID=4460 RepID=A0A843VDU2_COLES|nr:hypothetical protein [Colocasia esculenta]